MGCDMYCAVEALNKKTGKWECFGISTACRDYSLFLRMAGKGQLLPGIVI